MHHAFPARIDRLFYFDYCKAKGSNFDWADELMLQNLRICVPTYLEKGDWMKELRGCKGYRLSTVNEGFELCGS